MEERLASRDTVHAAVWLTWAASGMLAVQVTDGAVPRLLLLGIAAVVVEARAARGPLRSAFTVLVAFAGFFALVRAALTVMTTHPVGEEVLFRLPELTLPAMVGGFTVGGGIHGAVLERALVEGLAIVAIVGVLAAFNAVVSHAELLGLLPRAFHELGLAVTVALAFVPGVIESAREVRESAIARAGGPRRRGGTPRWILAVLETALERATRLAESLDARGLGHRPPGAAERRAARWGLAGMLLLLGAFAALVGRARPAAAVLAGMAVVLVVLAVRGASRAVARPRYRPRYVRGVDRVLSVWCLATVLVVAALAGTRPLLGDLVLLGLVVPAFVPRVRARVPVGAAR